MCCDVQFTDYQCKLTAGCRAEPAKVGINTTIAFQAIVLDEMNNRLPTLVGTNQHKIYSDGWGQANTKQDFKHSWNFQVGPSVASASLVFFINNLTLGSGLVVGWVGGWLYVHNKATSWPKLHVETCKLELNLSWVPSWAEWAKIRQLGCWQADWKDGRVFYQRPGTGRNNSISCLDIFISCFTDWFQSPCYKWETFLKWSFKIRAWKAGK